MWFISNCIFKDEFRRRVSERDSQSPKDVDAGYQSDNSIYLDVVGGVTKKGRIYGLGSEAASLAPSTSTASEGCSPSEMDFMRSLVADLTSQIQKQQGIINSQENRINSIMERLNLAPNATEPAADIGADKHVGDDAQNMDEDYDPCPPDV